MWIIINRALNGILSVIFPERCFGCGKENELLCVNCRKRLPYPEENNNGIIAATSYHSRIIKKAIKALKYRGIKRISISLAELIRERLFTPLGSSTSKWIIIPIPLHRKRLRQRGYNQSELIAKHLAKKMSVRIIENVLYRKRYTEPQADIKEKKKRLENMRDVFAVRNAGSIKNKTIFLADDVSTTGATMNEAKKVLLEAGAKEVIGIVVAK